jgi:hypothetical protein
MPTTWTAQKIHFLTQPELRALFRGYHAHARSGPLSRRVPARIAGL